MVRRLLLLNGLAAFGVATYHAAAYGFSAMFDWTDRYLPVDVPNYDRLGSFDYYFLLTIRQLDSFVIPAFIFVSGFFVAFAAGGNQSTLKWSVVIARIKSFSVPFVLWTGFRYALLRQVPSSIHDVLRVYYFIPLLIQYYLLSPFIVPVAKARWKLLLCVSALIEIAAESPFFLNDLGISISGLEGIRNMLPLWFFPRNIFWFALGLVTGFHRHQFRQWLVQIRFKLLIAVIVLGVLSVIEYQVTAYLVGEKWLGPSFRGITSRVYALAFILCFVAFDKVPIPFSKEFARLGGKSLGIYLVNIPAIYVAAVIMYRKLPWILGVQLLYQAILISVGVAIPLLLMFVVSRSPMRRAYRYLFG